MYRVAVCEDQETVRNELCAQCGRVLEEMGIPGEVTPFPGPEQLEEALQRKSPAFDLLLLDIQMEGKTGLELARELRQADDRIPIIFVSGCEEYLREGYSVQPIQFLLKSVEYQELYHAIHTAWRLAGGKHHAALLEGSRMVMINVGDVRYVEGHNHGILVHQGGEPCFYRVTLADAERSLQPSGRFCRCHNSFLVNMDNVSEITHTKVLLSSGEEIPIGRRYYEAAQKAFIRYMAQ